MNFSHLWSSALTQELGTDDSTRLFTDARRQDAINRGALQFCDLTECAVRQSTIACSNGIGEYNLLSPVNIPSGDYLRLSKQGPEFWKTSSGASPVTVYTAGNDLPRRDIAWLNEYCQGWRASTGGTPGAYYERMDGGQRYFGLTPPPTLETSSVVGKIILPYVAKPAVMTNSTDVPFTFNSTVRTDLEPYHQALAHFAASELEKLRMNSEGVQTQLSLFLGYVQRFLQALEPKGGRQVRFTRNYLTDARQARRGDDEQPVPYPWRR